jgi:hypothetical protein
MLPFVTTPRTGLKNGDQQTSACSHPGHFPAFTCHFLEIPGCNKGKCGYVHFSWSRSHFKARQRLQVKCSAENRNSGATGLLALRELWEILQLRFFRMGHFTPYGPLTNWALESTDLSPSEPTILGWSLKVGFMVGDRMSRYNDRKIMHTYIMKLVSASWSLSCFSKVLIGSGWNRLEPPFTCTFLPLPFQLAFVPYLLASSIHIDVYMSTARWAWDK